MTEAIAAQLRQQDIHVVLHTLDARLADVSIIPTDSGAMIRLQVMDQPAPQTPNLGDSVRDSAGDSLGDSIRDNGETPPPDLDEGAWQLTILFDGRSPQGLDFAQQLHAELFSRAGLVDGGMQSTTTLWPDRTNVGTSSPVAETDLTAITPDAAALIRLSPVTTLSEDYPPIPTTPIVWAIATATINRLK